MPYLIVPILSLVSPFLFKVKQKKNKALSIVHIQISPKFPPSILSPSTLLPPTHTPLALDRRT